MEFTIKNMQPLPKKEDLVKCFYQDLPFMNIPREGLFTDVYDIAIFECLDIPSVNYEMTDLPAFMG